MIDYPANNQPLNFQIINNTFDQIILLDQHPLIKAKLLLSLVFKYIDGWYNTQRIHSALDGKTPWEVFYEKCAHLTA